MKEWIVGPLMFGSVLVISAAMLDIKLDLKMMVFVFIVIMTDYFVDKFTGQR